jgi:hypothetical protein
MMVFSIPPICAPNRPNASLPGYHNQTDPLVSEPHAGVALDGRSPRLSSRGTLSGKQETRNEPSKARLCFKAVRRFK